MANTKNALLRTMVIDRCLSDKSRKYSTQNIMEECNKALSSRGMAEISSLNTIREDISAIQDQWMVEIATEVSGRNKYYSYRDKSFSIYSNNISKEVKAKFNNVMTLLEEIRSDLFI